MGSVSTISLNNDRDVVEELHNKHKYITSFAKTFYAFDVEVSEGSSTWACTRIAALALNACRATLFCALLLSCFDSGLSPSLLLVIRFFDERSTVQACAAFVLLISGCIFRAITRLRARVSVNLISFTVG